MSFLSSIPSLTDTWTDHSLPCRVFWLITIAYGAASILHFFVCKETYAPALLQSKTTKLQKETNNTELRSKLDDGLSARERMSHALIRPFKLLIFSPIVLFMSIYTAVSMFPNHWKWLHKY